MKFLDINGLSRLWNDMKAYAFKHGAINEQIVDYVIEEGTSYSWTYRKWNSGKMEAWKTFDCTVDFKNDLGSYIHYAKGTTNWALPTGFTSAPSVTCSVDSQGLILVNPVNITATVFNFNWVRIASNQTKNDLQVFVRAEGRWKKA